MTIFYESEKLGRLFELLRKHGDFYGVDESLEISLMQNNFVYKVSGMGTYTIILYLGEEFPGGPGYKIEVLDKYDILDPRNDHIPLPDEVDTLSGMANMHDAHLLHHTIKHGDFYYPSHYFDKPHPVEDLIEILEDTL